MNAEGQLSLLDKETGMARALSKDGIDGWKVAIRDYVEGLTPGTRVTSETITDRVGLPTGEVATNANNAVGAMINALARRGLISKSGQRVPSRRRTSHGAELCVWVRTNAS